MMEVDGTDTGVIEGRDGVECVLDMKSLGLFRKDAQLNNKYRRKIKAATS